MIENMQLLHYLSDASYNKICEHLDLALARNTKKVHIWCFEGKPINQIEMFNIKSGRCFWIIQVSIDYPRFRCAYEEFPNRLYEYLGELLGEDIMSSFPAYDALSCDYIEYAQSISVDNADAAITELINGKCLPPEQVDRRLWSKHKKPRGTPALCICKDGDTSLYLLAKCQGTAMKKRIKDVTYHRESGITPTMAVNANTERTVMDWVMHMNAVKNDKSPTEMVQIISGEKRDIALEFVELAEKLDLKYATRYAPGHKTWKCVFAKRRPSRVLFTIECTAEQFSIKANLLHIDHYKGTLSDASERIEGILRGAHPCNHCSPKCGGFPMTVNGATTNLCAGCAIYFDNMTAEEWQTIMKWIEMELAF